MVAVLDLFSAAAGGWSLGMHRAGYRTMAACEAVPWRRALYAQNNPGIRIYDDVRTLTAERLLADHGYLPGIIVGSPPCQDISSANTKGKGVEGERSGLYFEAVRIIGECRPRWFALENSANLRTRGADAVLAALEAIGYTCWAFVVGADDVGANHERARSWIIGCDLAQVTDADGFGRDDGWSGRRGRFDLSNADDHLDAARERHEGGRAWRHGPDGVRAAPASDTAQDGCGSGLSGRLASATGWAEQSPCGNAGHPDEQPRAARISPTPNEGSGDLAGGSVGSDAESGGNRSFHAANATGFGRVARAGDYQGSNAGDDGRFAGDDPDHGRIGPGHICKHGVRWPHACEPCDDAAWDARNASNADQARQARQAHGCMVSGIRQAEIADDGCGDGWSSNEPGERQVDIRPPDRRGTDASPPLWSLTNLAGRIRLDDGLPSRVAGTRVAVGGPKGTSAASLIVEAYGDAVVPQIPEAIGRAICRVEAALRVTLTPSPSPDMKGI